MRLFLSGLKLSEQIADFLSIPSDSALPLSASLDFISLNFACFSYRQIIPLSASAGDALKFKKENFEKFDAI
ncbi:hypothetical protein V6N13_016389 [Hibiscus sabdariffa]|uniref:Uncharacterized protein n=2 Tax=Hibiscus sabdariffa TaxID=183260 RepID=A0ABR2A7E6_9ROSI